MEKDKKTRLFEEVPVGRAVMTLAVPTIISSLVMVIYNLADTYFVGRLNDPIQNAAVTLAAPLILAFNAVNNLFGVGASSMMSRALGAKDHKTVRESSSIGFYMALICGVIFALAYTLFDRQVLNILGASKENIEATADYLLWTVTCGAVPAILNVVMAYLVRAEGSALHASIGTMSGCLLNIILDPIFILPSGLNMGASGAGCATFISNTVACTYFLVLLWCKRKTTYVSINPRNFKPNKKVLLGICGVGVPASIQNMLNVTGMAVLNNFTAIYGSDAIAAMGISHKISMIPMYISLGFSQGIMPLVSYNYASGNRKRMNKVIGCALKISLGFMTCIALVCSLLGGQLVELFMNNSIIIDYGSKFLIGMCLALPFLCIDFLAVGVYQACGMGKKALICAILRKVVLEIPALFILNKIVPLYGLAYAQLVAEFVLAMYALMTLKKICK